MRLHSRTGSTGLTHLGQHFAPGDDGAFDLPDHVAVAVRSYHVNKVPLWETDVERQQRLIREDASRRRDPSSQYDLLDRIMNASERGPDQSAEIAALKARLAELEAERGTPKAPSRRAPARARD